jgi:Helix-turn-helix domain
LLTPKSHRTTPKRLTRVGRGTRPSMSDKARNYVKHLDNSRLRPPNKSFLFFLADYHNVYQSSAWPSLQTLAEDTGLSLRYIRRLVKQCVELGLISHESGLGRGNRSRFRFTELDTVFSKRFEDDNQGRIGGRKVGQKGGQHDSSIRSEPKPEPEPRTEDPHASVAMKAWLTIKEQLRSELPRPEWELWVRPTYLLKVMDHKFLLLAMPPSSKIIEAAQKRKALLSTKMAEVGYAFGFTKYPDDFQRHRLEMEGWKFTSKRKPIEVAI